MSDPANNEGVGNSPSTQEGSELGGNAQGSESRPEWFQAWSKDFESKVDARFESMSSKYGKAIKELFGSKQPQENGEKPQGDAPGPQGLSAEQVESLTTSMMRFAELRASVPEGVREDLDRIRKENGLESAVIAAEAIAKHTSSAKNGVQGASPLTKGHSASPARNTTPSFPTTMSELAALQLKNPEEARKIVDHPDFDFSRLTN